jgi:hypothetical protein
MCGAPDHRGLFDVSDESRRKINQVTYTMSPVNYIISCTKLQFRSGYEFRVPRTPDEFAMVWRTSHQYSMLMQEIEEYDNEYPCESTDDLDFTAVRRSQQVKHLSVCLLF